MPRLRHWTGLLTAAALCAADNSHRSTTLITTTWTDPTTRRPSNVEPAWLDSSWHASSWSDCTPCSYGHVQIREVQCLAIFTMAVLSEDHCSNVDKPPVTQVCNCEEISCKGDSAECPAEKAEWFEPESPYAELGCFNLMASHDKVHGGKHIERIGGADYRDLSCLYHKGHAPCKSGLPFYSMKSNAMAPSLCFTFCTSKGLDIFGMVNGEECRCGFSAINRNARLRGAPVPSLEFQAARLKPHHSVRGICPLRVFRYSGYFEAGGLPPSLLKLSDVDVSYFRRVIHQWGREPKENDVWFFTHAPTTPKPGGPAKVGFSHSKSHNGNGNAWERSCYPDNCGPGGGPWPKRDPIAPRGVLDQFQLYCPIPYVFAEGLDSARKDAFRKAVRVWHESTCVVLIEHEPSEITSAMGPYIEVNAENEDKCYATRIGYPGYWGSSPQKAIINLGWCNSVYQLGNMVHEIGHVIGMNHEQKRLDATERVNGHGPYLKVFWDTMDDDSFWKHQYLPDRSSYMGSDSQGPGDPHVGFAPYDYGSIMHYGRTGRFEPLVKENSELLGNRDHLSESDIVQINDMYQCKELDSPSVDLNCDFEVSEDVPDSLCNWINVGEDTSKWQVHCTDADDRGHGPDTVAEDTSGNCYVYAEAADHPWELFILESPALSSFRDYVLTFSYLRSSIDTKFSVQYQSITGKSVEVFKDDGDQANEWIHQELKIFGDKAVTVRFVIRTTERSTSGGAVDHVHLRPRSGDVSTGGLAFLTQGPEKSWLERAVDAFNNLLDAIFSRKYAEERATPKEWQESPRAFQGPWQVLACLLSLFALTALALTFTRNRFRPFFAEEEERLMDGTDTIFSAREFVVSEESISSSREMLTSREIVSAAI